MNPHSTGVLHVKHLGCSRIPGCPPKHHVCTPYILGTLKKDAWKHPKATKFQKPLWKAVRQGRTLSASASEQNPSFKNSPAVQGWNLSASTFNPVIILPLVQPLWFPIPSSFGSPFSQLTKPNHPVSHWEFPKLRVSWAKNKRSLFTPLVLP